MIFLIAVALWTAEARASSVASLDLSAKPLVNSLARRLFADDEPSTLRQLRHRYAVALIYGTYPFNTEIAVRIRKRIREMDWPDSTAVLTRGELAFAEALITNKLNMRARNFLADRRPRTMAEFVAIDQTALELVDEWALEAAEQLHGLRDACERTLAADYQPKT